MGTVAAPSLDPMDMLSTDNQKNIFNWDLSSTEHGLKYLHLLNFSPRTQRVSGEHEDRQENMLLLLHTTCLKRYHSICSPHWGCSGNLQLLKAQIWLTKFREHSEGRAFFFIQGISFSKDQYQGAASEPIPAVPSVITNCPRPVWTLFFHLLPTKHSSMCLPLISGTAWRQ